MALFVKFKQFFMPDYFKISLPVFEKGGIYLQTYLLGFSSNANIPACKIGKIRCEEECFLLKQHARVCRFNRKTLSFTPIFY